MAKEVPSTGELSLYNIAKVVEGLDYTNSTPAVTFKTYYADPISLGNMSTGAGGFRDINQYSTSKPDGSAPHSMSEFRGYNYDATPSFNTSVDEGNSYSRIAGGTSVSQIVTHRSYYWSANTASWIETGYGTQNISNTTSTVYLSTWQNSPEWVSTPSGVDANRINFKIKNQYGVNGYIYIDANNIYEFTEVSITPGPSISTSGIVTGPNYIQLSFFVYGSGSGDLDINVYFNTYLKPI